MGIKRRSFERKTTPYQDWEIRVRYLPYFRWKDFRINKKYYKTFLNGFERFIHVMHWFLGMKQWKHASFKTHLLRSIWSVTRADQHLSSETVLPEQTVAWPFPHLLRLDSISSPAVWEGNAHHEGRQSSCRVAFLHFYTMPPGTCYRSISTHKLSHK